MMGTSMHPLGEHAQRLTRHQAAVIGAVTGICCGPFEDIQGYAENVLGRPIWTHEFASQQVADELKKAAWPDFLALCAERPPCICGLDEDPTLPRLSIVCPKHDASSTGGPTDG